MTKTDNTIKEIEKVEKKAQQSIESARESSVRDFEKAKIQEEERLANIKETLSVEIDEITSKATIESEKQVDTTIKKAKTQLKAVLGISDDKKKVAIKLIIKTLMNFPAATCPPRVELTGYHHKKFS